MVLFFSLLIAGVFLIIVHGYNYLSARERRDSWQLVGEKLGLNCQNDSISGTLDGISVVASLDVRGSSKTDYYYTVFIVTLGEGVPDGLSIQAERIFNKLAKLTGSHSVRLGHADLDSRLMVKAKSEVEVREWIKQDGVLEALRWLVALNFVTFSIANNQLHFKRTGAMSNAIELETQIRDLVACASSLSKKRRLVGSRGKRQRL